MKCQACNGKISMLQGMPTLDQRGVCSDCGAVYVKNVWERDFLGRRWCDCKNTSNQEVFYFSDNGNHGWMHAVCGQVTQTG